MANTVLTADIVAKEAVMILENNLVMAKQVFRGYESDFAKKVNGYEVGETISIRVPADFTVTKSRTMQVQDVVERKIPLTVDKQYHTAFKFTSADLTLKIEELSERIMKPQMVQLANAIDEAIMAEYVNVINWVGTPGQVVNSFADFAKAPERLDELGVPFDQRSGILTPADYWAMAGSQTALFNNSINQQAYRRGRIGDIGGVETFMAQNTPTHTVGNIAGSSVVDGALNPHTLAYGSVLTAYSQTITVDTFTDAAPLPAVGDVFTIAPVYAVNPVTKAKKDFLKQFTVTAVANAGTNQVDITFTPPIITPFSSTPQFATAWVAEADTDIDGEAVVWVGTASTAYRQNMVFHKNAFALVMVPLVAPPGATDVGRQSYKGTSVRVIPTYSGENDESRWRVDVLFGTKTVDPRMAVRLSGTA